MIDDIVSGLLGGYAADWLLRRVPPKKGSEFDRMPIDELRLRNNWIDVAGTVVFGGGFCLMFVGLEIVGMSPDVWQSVWRIVGVFCFPLALTLLFVSAVALPKGIRRFRECWRFHELKHRTRLALLLSMYVPFAAVGLFSAFKVVLGLAGK